MFLDYFYRPGDFYLGGEHDAWYIGSQKYGSAYCTSLRNIFKLTTFYLIYVSFPVMIVSMNWMKTPDLAG